MARNTGPRVAVHFLLPFFQQSHPLRVEVRIVDRRSKTVTPSCAAMIAILDQQRAIAPAKPMSPKLMSGVQTPRVGILQPLHTFDEVGFGSSKHQMIAMAHQGPGVDFPFAPRRRLAQVRIK